MNVTYFFWHVPRTGVDEAVYAARLVRFQEELEALGSGVTGLLADPQSYRLEDVPWMNTGRAVYLDAYPLDSFASMELLNTASVTGPLTQPHADIAALFGSGAGSLYEMRFGLLDPAAVGHGYWFSKPAGMTYDEINAILQPLAINGGAVFRRLMVLGPSPEFCLLSPEPVGLPAPITPAYRPLTRI
ncbi:MAG: hypothetical protein JNK87_11000 [Bryobacterales bacterium]|nr:hypothetical protein [Bryobacterales bacterium]